MPRQIDGVGLSPDDAALLVTELYAKGPIAYDLATGAEPTGRTSWPNATTGRTRPTARCSRWGTA